MIRDKVMENGTEFEIAVANNDLLETFENMDYLTEKNIKYFVHLRKNCFI